MVTHKILVLGLGVRILLPQQRRVGRAVEYIGLENRQTCKCFGGSNPSLSANSLIQNGRN